MYRPSTWSGILAIVMLFYIGIKTLSPALQSIALFDFVLGIVLVFMGSVIFTGMLKEYLQKRHDAKTLSKRLDSTVQ